MTQAAQFSFDLNSIALIDITPILAGFIAWNSVSENWFFFYSAAELLKNIAYRLRCDCDEAPPFTIDLGAMSTADLTHAREVIFPALETLKHADHLKFFGALVDALEIEIERRAQTAAPIMN